MCGIAGVVNGEKTWAGLTGCNKFMEQAATVGVLRGTDSTGMFQVKKDKDVNIYKLPVEGGFFANTKRADSMFRNVDSSLVTVIHHRAATRGEISPENTHPFRHGDGKKHLVGVHNGSLTGTPSNYDGKSFAVDSDYALYRIFQEREEAFQDLHGPYTFVWWESDGKLRVACNGERSFAFGFMKEKNVMLMASEPAMLYWLATRNDIALDDIVQPENFRMLTFDPLGDLRAFEDTAIKKPVIRAYQGGRQTTGNFPHQQGGLWENRPATTSALPALIKATAPSALVISKEIKDELTTGMEVEFYPTLAESTKEQLFGDVLLDGIGGEPAIIPAVLSNPSAAMYSNLLSGQVNVLYAKVRSMSKMQAAGGKSRDVLLLHNPTMSVSKDKAVTSYNENILVDGPGGAKLSVTAFMALVANGCGICGKEVSLNEGIKGNVGWAVHNKTPICSVCCDEMEGKIHAG